MRILRRAQNEFIVLQHVNEAGVALCDGADEIDDALQDLVQRIGGGHAAANLMEKSNRRIFQGKDRLVHEVKVMGGELRVKRKESFG